MKFAVACGDDCPGLRHCGDNTGDGTGGGDIVGGGTGGPMQPHVQPSLRDGGMRSFGTDNTTPERTIRHVPAHVSYNAIPIPQPVMSLQPWVSERGLRGTGTRGHVMQ